MKYYKVMDTDRVKWYVSGNENGIIVYYLANHTIDGYHFVEVRPDITPIEKYIDRLSAMSFRDKDLKELTLKEFTDNVIDLLAFGVDMMHEQIDKLIKNEKQGGKGE